MEKEGRIFGWEIGQAAQGRDSFCDEGEASTAE